MLLMNRNSGFSIDCCPHPTPSLAMRAMLVPEGEGLVRRTSNYQHALSLAGFQPLVALADDKQLATAAHHLTVATAVFCRFQRR